MFDIVNKVEVSIGDIFELLANVVTIGSIIYKLIPFRMLDNPISKAVGTVSLNRNPCPVAEEIKRKEKEKKERQ